MSNSDVNAVFGTLHGPARSRKRRARFVRWWVGPTVVGVALILALGVLSRSEGTVGNNSDLTASLIPGDFVVMSCTHGFILLNPGNIRVCHDQSAVTVGLCGSGTCQDTIAGGPDQGYMFYSWTSSGDSCLGASPTCDSLSYQQTGPYWGYSSGTTREEGTLAFNTVPGGWVYSPSTTLIQSYYSGGGNTVPTTTMNIYPDNMLVESQIGCNTAGINDCGGDIVQGFLTTGSTGTITPPESGTYQVWFTWYLWWNAGLDTSLDLAYPGSTSASGSIELVANMWDVTTGQWVLSTPYTLDVWSGTSASAIGDGAWSASDQNQNLVWNSDLTAGNSYQFESYLYIATTAGCLDIFGNAWSNVNVGTGGDNAQLYSIEWTWL